MRAAQRSDIPAETVQRITATYLDARYGPPDPALLRKLESDVTALR